MSLIEIDSQLLKKTCKDSGEDTPTLYMSDNFLLRKFFWLRLATLIKLIGKYSKASDPCLDLGGGGGHFLPTLCDYFDSVVMVDRDTSQASLLKKYLNLDNVDIKNLDVFAFQPDGERFKTIVAADVLEHFYDLEPIITKLKDLMDDGGHLYVSCPTENVFYRLLRIVFKVKKPKDHYHDASQVESELRRRGFKKIDTALYPVPVSLLALFSITVWGKNELKS